MPFFDEQRSIGDLTNIAPEDAPPPDPGLLDVFGAAFRTQNTIGSLIASSGQPNPYEIEDGFDAIDYVKDDPKFAPYVDEFSGIFNRKAADAKKIQIEREEQDRRTVEAGGVAGIVGSMAAGVFDLPTLLPIGGPLIGQARGIGNLALRVGLASGLDAGVSEAALQATQTGRTAGETMINIGGSVVLGGALGALVGRYLTPGTASGLSRKIEGQEAAFKAMDDALATAPRGFGTSVGAAARETGPLVLKDEALIKRLPGINIQDPLIRSQLSGLDATRQTVRGLAETPLEYADNALGIATERGGAVETRIKMWNAPTAEKLRGMDTLYARYFHNAPEPTAWQTRLSPLQSEWARFRGGQKLTYKQFKEEVGRAAFSGQKHDIPEVAQAAMLYREWDDALKQAAIDARLFPEDVAVKGDISHLFRMYDREKIVARRDDWTTRLVDYLKGVREKALSETEEIRLANKIVESDRVQGRFDQVSTRLDAIEGRIAGRQGIRGRRMSELQELRATRFDVMRERAPAGVVRSLRGADENASMIGVVREARARARSQAVKQPYAKRYPVLSIIRGKGGVRIGSVLDGNLRAMGVTPKTHPGLFRLKGGLGDVDNFVRSEDDVLANLADAGNDYADPRDIMAAIRDEVGGNPLRSAEDLADDELTEAMERTAQDWLESVGLGPDATVKDVRDYIRRVIGAEKDLDGLDLRISNLEKELDDFDKATDALRNDREITAQEAKMVADELNALEDDIAPLATMANASPRVKLIVDLATTKRDLFKAKLVERNLRKRVGSLEGLQKAGRANDEMLAELAAKSIELDQTGAKIAKLSAKADKLEPMVKTAQAADKLDEFANLSDAELRSLVDEITDSILGNAEGRIPYDIVAGPRGALKERTLNIQSEKIADFMELDIESVMRAQQRTMAPDVELSRKFGSVDMAEEIRKINDEANAKIAAATTEKQRKAIQRQRETDIRDIQGIRDRLRGTYALPSNPSSLVVRAGRVARNLNYVRLLGGMTLSAIPDTAKIVFTHGLTSTFRDGFLPMVRNFKAFRIAAGEVKAAGTALDMILDSRTMAMADIMDDFGRHSKFERGLSAVSSKFGVVSLMAPWNAAMKQFTGLITMTNLLRSAKRWADGVAGADEIRRLAASGIDLDIARSIARQFDEYGEVTDGIWLAQTGAWTDQAAKEAVRAAVVRDVDRIIVTPGQDKPLWMSTDLGKMVGQFKSFSVSSMQKTTLAGLQQRDAATLNGTLLMLGLGALTYAVKEKAAGREVSDDPRVWAVNALDRSGLTGWLMEANNIAEKATRGRVGLSAISGEQVSRYASRNVYGAFLGPSADAVADIFQVSGSIFAGDTTKSDLHRARMLVPFQNLFYLRSLFDKVEEATGDTLGLADTRRN